MDERQMQTWHEKREALFAVNLPASALTVINKALPKLEHDIAIEALEVYAKRKPYKGFYMIKYLAIYERVAQDHPRGGDRAPGSARPPAKTLPDFSWRNDQQAEREAYHRLPDPFLAECREKYAAYGWKVGSREWMILCLEAYAGNDVERYRVHTTTLRDLDRGNDFKAKAEYMQRVGYLELIEKLRAEVHRLGGSVDVMA